MTGLLAEDDRLPREGEAKKSTIERWRIHEAAFA